MITIYSDRIEILSRGTIDGAQTIEGLFAGESVPVNKKLSEMFLQLHISEKTCRGVPVITSLYIRKAFEFRENSIVVTIPFKWINVRDAHAGSNVGDESGNIHLSETHKRILAEMRNNPDITKPQLMLAIGVGKTSIDNGVSYLRIHGLIERIGSNKTGYWTVNN